MRFNNSITVLAFAAVSVLIASHSVAGTATMTTPDNIDIKLGARLHVLANASDDEAIDGRDELDLQVRRARLRFTGTVDEWITLFLQTEMAGQNEKSGADMVIIDASVTLAPQQATQVVLGQHMAPALRQNLTSSGAMLAIDRPVITYKSLNWGTRALSGFSRITENETDAGLRGEVDVRDTGATFFGVSSINDVTHIKYYAGIYEGALSAEDNHLGARMQLNFGHAEQGYYNAANYSGNKNTLALGLSLDQQNQVAYDASSRKPVDYSLASVDVFIAQGDLTFEAAYIDLNLSGADVLAFRNGNLLSTDKAKAIEAEGRGYYLQAAWLFGKWQPWLGFEQWRSNAENDAGSFTNARLGLSYLVNKESSFKLGLENWQYDNDVTTGDASFNTLTAGYFITF